MAISVFAEMDKIMLAPLEAFIDSGSGGLMSYVSGPLKVSAILYIALYGWFILKGAIQEPAMDFIFKCMKIVIIIMLATDGAQYTKYVKDVFFETLPNEIGNALGSSPSSGNPYDKILTTATIKGMELWKAAEWGAGMVFSAILAFLILVAGLFLAIVGYVVSLYAKVALAMVLALGPVFIALALFDSTRRFTEGWIGQLANYVILQILVVAIGSLILTSLIAMANAIDSAGDAATAAVTFAAITMSCAYIFYQLPAIASALAAGGASLAYGYGASRDVNAGAQQIGGAARTMGNATKAAYYAVKT